VGVLRLPDNHYYQPLRMIFELKTPQMRAKLAMRV
jgi:hypothetical protein